MKILLTGNCQVDGLHVCMARALPQLEIHRLPHLATFYGEFTEEHIAEEHAWADLVFYHTKHDGDQDYPTKNTKVPLSVFYQGGAFIAEAHDQDWEPIQEYANQHGKKEAIYHAVFEADMGYTRRWKDNLDRMIEKEDEDNVPEEIRMSDIAIHRGRTYQQQLTMNHPTTIVFRDWANRLIKYIGETPGPNSVTFEEALAKPNLAGLPCEQSATSGAVKHLALLWGGRPEDNQSGRDYAITRLT